MAEYYMNGETDSFLRWQGRILEKQGTCYFGYTNSSLELSVKGSTLYMYMITGDNEVVNQPGFRIYVDGKRVSELVLDRRKDWYLICELSPGEIHEVRIIKITEAAMSYGGLRCIKVCDGELLPFKEKADNRTRVEFIGDSITCGYGVHGEPESEYTIREEDGECSYAAFMTREMNWNARWISASGYGMFVEYTGNPDNNVPKLYPYVNWFVDREQKIEAEEFEPEYIFVNLGTNDSGHLYKEEILKGFLKAYEDFLMMLKDYHKESIIICVLGTLCQGVFPYVEQVVEKVKAKGMENIYVYELPYHDVERDGMASMHPSVATHKKDAKRILDFMKQEGIL